MRILIACEYSGIVREAFRKKGHNAFSCDLLPTEIPGPHYQGDVFNIIDKKWDMMIAHPPCTYLSNAGAGALYSGGKLNIERYKKGLKAKDFFMVLLNSLIKKIVIENPIASLIYKLPKYSQIVSPHYFGEPFSKKTCLWLKNLPLLKSTEILKKYDTTKTAGNWYNKGGKDRQKNRAKTFQAIANAMADQWGQK